MNGDARDSRDTVAKEIVVDTVTDTQMMRVVDQVALSDWAHYYVEVGHKPLPKQSGAKYPSVAWEPYQERIPTTNEIARWFSNGADGICLVLDGTNYVVLDCDGPRDRARHLLSNSGIEIPALCPRVVTGRDRDHFYFRTTRPVGRHIGIVQDDGGSIDILGAGIVVAPPSIHPDTNQAYRWVPPFRDPADVPVLPARVYELITEAQRPTEPRLAPVDGPILEGERERTLTSMLGAARRRGATEPELRALAQAANDRCVPPLTARDLNRLARSIARCEPDDLDVAALVASVEPAQAPVPALSFVTPAELQADPQAQIDHVLQPYFIAGTLTDLTGATKIGKTRFRNYLIRCAVTGTSCLGYPATAPTKVVLLTEEPVASLIEGLAAAGLTDTRDVVILTRYAARGADWPAMVAAANAKACEIGARLLVADTLPGLARLEGDAENSSGHALAALRPLQEADTPGVAKLVIRHTRKSGGDLIEAGRGSSAFAGEADVLVTMSRPRGARPTVRRLEAIGRFEAIPPVLTVERLTVDGYIPATTTDPPLPESNTSSPVLIEHYIVTSRAEAADPEAASVSDRVAQTLPHTALEALTVSALAASMNIPERSVRYGLTHLGGQVARRGEGTRSDPYRFFVTANPDLKGLHECNQFHTDTKGGDTMASMAGERGPPRQSDRAVHESAGVESPGTTDTNRG